MSHPEHTAANAFSRQSEIFDQADSGNPLAGHLRGIVRSAVEENLPFAADILELNCGTGLDAFYFASKGHSVLATDAAPGMIARVRDKLSGTGAAVEPRLLSYHDLHQLKGQKFDHIFSNFGGLNCTPDLAGVLRQLPALLREDGMITLVIMPRVCPWELMMAFKGKFATAFRRFRRRTPAKVEGVKFYCYYYNPSYVIRHLRDKMDLVDLKGIYVTVPPEFYSGFVERYPRLYRTLSKVDEVISSHFPFNRWCDHFMITMRKKSE